MRISVDPDDPGFDPDCHGTRVWLNGVELHGVVTADTGMGLVVCLDRDSEGKFYRGEGGGLKRVMRFGQLRVELPAGHPSSQLNEESMSEASVFYPGPLKLSMLGQALDLAHTRDRVLAHYKAAARTAIEVTLGAPRGQSSGYEWSGRYDDEEMAAAVRRSVESELARRLAELDAQLEALGVTVDSPASFALRR